VWGAAAAPHTEAAASAAHDDDEGH
jgi:hypothetical protein